VYPDIAGKRVVENNIQQLSWDWPGDGESILPIVTSIVNTTIVSIVNAAITGLPDPSGKVRELWGCLEERDGDGGPCASKVTSIFDNNTAAGWVKGAIKLSNPTLFCLIYHSQQADSTDGALTPMRGGHSYLPLNNILPPPAEDVIDDIQEESDDDGETQYPNPRSFLTTKSCFENFELNLQKTIIREQRYIQVIRNSALSLVANYE
jgi:hypothetical protein